MTTQEKTKAGKADIVNLVNKLKQLDNAQQMYIAGAIDLACAMHQQPAPAQ